MCSHREQCGGRDGYLGFHGLRTSPYRLVESSLVRVGCGLLNGEQCCADDLFGGDPTCQDPSALPFGCTPPGSGGGGLLEMWAM